jgi:hypothetical protein
MPYAKPTTSAPGTPLLTRLARRQRAALSLMSMMPYRATNRLNHIAREAERAGITQKQIRDEIARLQKWTSS